MTVKDVTLSEAEDVMIDAGYAPEDFTDKFANWLESGRNILIFTNEDLGHRMLGFKLATPWDAGVDLPTSGPDTELGLGWRYIPSHIVRASSE